MVKFWRQTILVWQKMTKIENISHKMVIKTLLVVYRDLILKPSKDPLFQLGTALAKSPLI